MKKLLIVCLLGLICASVSALATGGVADSQIRQMEQDLNSLPFTYSPSGVTEQGSGERLGDVMKDALAAKASGDPAQIQAALTEVRGIQDFFRNSDQEGSVVSRIFGELERTL